MPSGISSSATTNKTEFQRFVDERPEAVSAFAKRLREFNDTPGCKHFGAWMRTRHLTEFSGAYRNWWQTRPELFGEIYRQ